MHQIVRQRGKRAGSAAAHLVERQVLVNPHVRWQAEDPLRNHVLPNLFGASAHAIARCEQQALLDLVQIRIRRRIDHRPGRASSVPRRQDDDYQVEAAAASLDTGRPLIDSYSYTIENVARPAMRTRAVDCMDTGTRMPLIRS